MEQLGSINLVNTNVSQEHEVKKKKKNITHGATNPNVLKYQLSIGVLDFRERFKTC